MNKVFTQKYSGNTFRTADQHKNNIPLHGDEENIHLRLENEAVVWYLDKNYMQRF